MTVPRHLTARLDVETAHTQVVIRNCYLFFGKIDLSKKFFRDVFMCLGTGLLAVGCYFACRAFPCHRRSKAASARSLKPTRFRKL